MRIAHVIGTTISTLKDEKLSGLKLLLVQDTDLGGKVRGEPYIAVDTVDAGTGDLVVIAEGSSARYTSLTENTPVDAAVVAVIDSLETSGNVTFRKE